MDAQSVLDKTHCERSQPSEVPDDSDAELFWTLYNSKARVHHKVMFEGTSNNLDALLTFVCPPLSCCLSLVVLKSSIKQVFSQLSSLVSLPLPLVSFLLPPVATDHLKFTPIPRIP